MKLKYFSKWLLTLSIFISPFSYAEDDNWYCSVSFVGCGNVFKTQPGAIQAGHDAVISHTPARAACDLTDPYAQTFMVNITNGKRYRWTVKPVADGTSTCSPGVWGFNVIEHRCNAGYYWNNTANPTSACQAIPSCPTGETFNHLTEECEGPIDPYKPLGMPPQGTCPIGNPVHPGTGNKFQIETDYVSPVPGGLRLQRYYNSQAVPAPRFGNGWFADYWQRIQDVAGGISVVRAIRPDGKRYTFIRNGSDWEAEPDVSYQLTELKDGSGNRTGWELILPDDTVEIHEYASGTSKILSSTDRNGLTTTFDYDLIGGTTNPLFIDVVIDPFGRELQFLYDTNEYVKGFIDPDGNEYEYVRDGSNRVTSVVYPDDTPLTDADNPRRVYHYEDTNFPNSLTGITDENDNRFATYEYDAQNRVVVSEQAGGANSVELTYNIDGTTTITDALGAIQNLSFETLHRQPRLNEITGDLSGHCANQYIETTYDTNGYIASRTDFNSNVTTYVHNSRGLETSRTEADGETEERTITTTWHSTFRLPTDITEPGRETTFTYDGVGRLLTKTVTDTTTLDERTTTYTYHDGMGTSPEGLLESVNGPRTDVSDVTTYEYDAEGNLILITNALSHETEITSHDAHGRPLTMEDPNATVTTMTYDKRGRLLTRTVDSKTTEFEYDGAGNITKTILPNGAYLINEYDDAQRLVAVEDNLGNRIEYTLDAQGNRIEEDVRDPGDTLTRTLERTYNDLNRLVETLGGAGQEVVYGYDDNGNQTGMTVDPTGLNQATTQAFDALNRLISTEDADEGVTEYAYDARDNLISVTDPNELVTEYDYDGLNNLIEQTSPDTGVTTYEHDAAGNRIEQTDARNVTVEYEYDALNRLLTITYPDITNPGDNPQNVTFTYDTCTNGIGRLCEMIDASGTTEYDYDARGNLTDETLTRGIILKTVSYAYDDADNLTEITYPSGRTVDYSRNAIGQVETVETTDIGTETVADNISYHPFGPLDTITYGNNLMQARSYDLDYRLSQLLTVNGSTYQDLGYTYDDANNITVITNYEDGTRSQTFDYDVLNRLTDASGIYGDFIYTYDANGNRLTEVLDMATETYSYVTNTHRLDEITNGSVQSFSYDNNGNTTSNTNYDFVYGDNNRLTAAEVSSVPVGEYVYNGKGERVIKDATDTILYYYDQNGLLLAELDDNGDTLREYVYLNGMPLAMIDSSGTYYYHTDHLGTPQMMTDDIGTVVWAADYEPFGRVDITTSTITNSLRFLGQYYDLETDLHHNGFRTYDPSTGRYTQSDPIGLGGGTNTYGYVFGNPIQYADPTGQFPQVIVACVMNPACRSAATAGVTATGYGLSLGWQKIIGDNPIVIDPNKPIPPQIPGYIDPSSIFAGTEALSCPVQNGSPLDPRERCFNGVLLQFGLCMQSGTNPVICQAKRVLGILLCSTRSPDDGDG